MKKQLLIIVKEAGGSAGWNNMFLERLISGIILIIITVATLISGGNIMFAVIIVISLIGLSELYRTIGMSKSLPAIVSYLASIAIDLFIYFQKENDLLVIFIFALISIMTI